MSSSDSPLGPRLRRWIAAEAGETVAERFYPWVRETLQDLGYDLSGPATEADLRRTRAVLRRADVTPARMQRAAREARRAEAEGLTALEWARSV